MAFKISQNVIWVQTELDPIKSVIKSGQIEKVINRDEVKLVGHQYPMYAAFLYPDIAECADHLRSQIDLAIRHKEEQDAFMKKTYQLNNLLVTSGLK